MTDNIRAQRSRFAETYVPNLPCKRGHFERYVSTNKCAICARERTAAWQINNPERYAEHCVARGIKHRESDLARLLAWGAAHPERQLTAWANWKATNPEKSAASKAAWAAANGRAYAAARYAANPASYKERARLRKIRNPEGVRANVRNNKARRRGAMGKHSAAQTRHLLKKQKGKCAYFRICGTRIHLGPDGCHEDHIIPVSKGGSNDISNIQLTCEPCNLHKHAKDALVFARELGLLL